MQSILGRFFIALACMLGMIQTSSMVMAAETRMPAEILTRLPNGLLVYVLRDARFPLACSRLYVQAGSATEDPAQAGISHVLEHMVFKGTSHRPKGQVARDVEELGGYLNAATSFDRTWYITDMPAAHWRVGMDVVRDMAFQATLDQKELDAEKNVVISELQRGEDSPMRKLAENLQVAALKNTPYGRPIIGFEESIRALTVEDLRRYVKKWYQPQNMMLLVAGDINPDEVLAHAQKLFGDLRNDSDLTAPPALDLATAATGSQKVEVVRGPWNMVYLGVGLPVPGIGDFASVDLDVLAYLLGGDATSTLYRKYKYDRQLVDNISAGNMSLARAGMFTVMATLDAENLEAFWQEFTAEMGALTAGDFPQEAIDRAKFNLEDSMDRAGETLNGLVSWKAAIQLDFGGAQGEENLRFVQANVDKAQLQKAISAWLGSGQARVVVMAPQGANVPDLEQIMNANWPPRPVAPTQKAGAEPVVGETLTFDGGCQLIMLPDDSVPYLSLELMLPGGNAMLKPEQQGLAALTARMLSDGCGELNKNAMERWLAERAVSLSARAGLQTFAISMDGPSRFSADMFGVFHNVLLKPRFEAGELGREIRNMKAAIARRDDQPLSFMLSRVHPFLFPGGQPYGYDNLGSLQSLENINMLDVRDYWTRQGGQPWILAIAGKFNRDEVVKFARSLAVPHMIRFSADNPVWNDQQFDLQLKLPGRNQAHLMRIFRTVPATDVDAPGLLLLQAAITGQSGILFSQLRDQEGLGYTVTAFNRAMPKTGFLAFYIGTTEDKLAQSREGFDRIINSLKTGLLSQELLTAAANRLWGDYARGRQSLASRAGEAATDAILGRPRDFQKQLIEAAQKCSPEEIRRIAQTYLQAPYEVILTP